MIRLLMRKKYILSSLLLAGLCVGLMIHMTRGPSSVSSKPGSTLVVWCAAGIKGPMEELSLDYERAYNTRIQIRYGGSGTLLGGIEASHEGDLLVAADSSYLADLRKKKLAAESIPLAAMRPVLAVAKGNPKNIRGWRDLLDRSDIKLGLCHPHTAAIGRTIHDLADKRGDWTALTNRSTVQKSTVTELSADLLAGALDATFLWDQMVAAMPNLEPVPCPELQGASATVPAIVLASCQRPASALHFARWLASPEHGAPVFRSHHFQAEGGDAWEESPEMTLFSGSVNRPAIERILENFCQREGARVKTVYNGCGVLCATMRAADKNSASLPDAYYACDICFVPPVADLFSEAVRVTETDIVIAVPAGNPHQIRTLSDLTKPGLRLGVCDVKQSALGFLTERLLDRAALLNAVGERVVSRVPTGDLLVNQLRAGSLDAAIVYKSNLATLNGALVPVIIDHPAAKAVQPYAVGDKSRHRQLASRLLEAVLADTDPIVRAGFRMVLDPAPVPSKSFDAPGFEKQ